MNKWWIHYPWRMIQTNLRQIDMEHIDAKKFAQDLKDFGATVVLLNAAGIIASYDTELPFQYKSEYLHGDGLEKIIDECHSRDIKVICRTDFSKVRYKIYEQHPEWAYVSPQGKIVNYNGDVAVCLNGAYQQERKFEIIQEVLEKFQFDGIFCNMGGFQVKDYSGVYYGPCHCEACKKLFRERYGEDIPDQEDMSDPVYQKYQQFKNECLAEHKSKTNSTIRKIRPDIAINQQDYIRTESNTEIDRQQWIYSASMNSRLSSGIDKLRPSDNACVDFIGYRYRHISVSPQLMELRQWQNLANSGCVSMYIMGTLENHRDISAFAPTKKVFAFHSEHEELFRNMSSASEVVLVRKDVHFSQEEPEGYGWIRVLTESHIPFDEVKCSEFKSIDQLSDKRVLILGDLEDASSEILNIADRFAKDGGIVIASGKTGVAGKENRLKCLGISEITDIKHDQMSAMFEIRDEDRSVFSRCVETPYIMPGAEIIHFSSDKNAERYLRFIPEHPFGPPERCYFTECTDDAAVSAMSYGKGKGVYIAFSAAAVYRKEGYQNTLAFLQDVLFNVAGVYSVAPDLTNMTEITMNQSCGKLILQLVNTSGVFANSYFDPLAIKDISLKVPKALVDRIIFDKDNKVYKVNALNGGSAAIKQNADDLEIKLKCLNNYEALVIEGA